MPEQPTTTAATPNPAGKADREAENAVSSDQFSCPGRTLPQPKGEPFEPLASEFQGSGPARDIDRDIQPRHQLVDEVVRELVSEYPGTIQSVNLPTPDSALVRLHRGDSTWLVSIARLAVTDG